ncbi:MAG: tetratricopeptide repeat protein [Candidatus Izemoplasmatales bacterium]|nr:tetratricopeptide repeat protein [Candidatus Izemoplasmatales bacterium]
MNNPLNPKALNDLGDKYFYGIDSPKNIELAFTYYKQAADQGNPVGLYHVGEYFLVKQEYRHAIEYLHKAMASGYSKAFLTLSEMTLHGQGMRKSKKKAFKYTANGAKLGDIDAINQLGRFYLNGIGCSKDFKKAWETYQFSADKNDPEGMFQFGRLHLESASGKKNPEKAIHWLDKSALSGHRDAILQMREIYQKPHAFFKKRSLTFLKEMIFYYDELLAKTGAIDACERVAIAYLEGGCPTKQNSEKAAEYLKTLLKADNTIGHYGIGYSAMMGLGEPQNPLKAIQHLEIAAKRGMEQAMIKLGDLYRLGIQQPTDSEMAKKWYYEAAKKNAPEALVNLGLLHYRNQIANASGELAFQYFENAAKKGNHAAHYWLGILHERGIGRPVDLSLAEKSYQKALAGGVSGAYYKYAVLLYERSQKAKQKNKAKRWSKKAIELFRAYLKEPSRAKPNEAYSCYYLALLYQSGMGVEKSLRISRYWLERSSELGLGKAMVALYQLLKKNDFDHALHFLKQAALERHDPEGLYELGILFLQGHSSLESNPVLARQYLEASAKKMYRPAIERLTLL